MAAKSKRENNKNIALLFVALSLIAFGTMSLSKRWQATHNPAASIPTEVVTHTTDKPDETQPPCDVNYKVAADEPRKIEISSIGVSGCIHKVGIDQNSSVAAPANLHLAGWYVNSPAPGKKGVSLIDGHVQGRYADGIFKNLEKMRVGDITRIQLGDHSWREFEVVDLKSYPLNEVADKMLLQIDGVDSQLTLVTCGGKFDKQSNNYSERVIVRGKLLN